MSRPKRAADEVWVDWPGERGSDEWAEAVLGRRLQRRAHRNASAQTKSKRILVFERDRYRCRYCGHAVRLIELQRPKYMATLDHVIPVSRGGTRDMENLVTACCRCNNKKADKSVEEAGMVLLPLTDR